MVTPFAFFNHVLGQTLAYLLRGAVRLGWHNRLDTAERLPQSEPGYHGAFLKMFQAGKKASEQE